METDTVNPQPIESGHDTEPKPGSGPERILLRRSLNDRMVAGVAGGLARYLGVDAVIVRIAFVVLTFFGGVGIVIYLAGLLLIPDEGSDESLASSLIESVQTRSR